MNKTRSTEAVELEAEPEQAPEPGTHKVKAGETLTSIAIAHGIGWQRLMTINGMTSPRVKVGEVLKVR